MQFYSIQETGVKVSVDDVAGKENQALCGGTAMEGLEAAVLAKGGLQVGDVALVTIGGEFTLPDVPAEIPQAGGVLRTSTLLTVNLLHRFMAKLLGFRDEYC
jgi:hypothetical protein